MLTAVETPAFDSSNFPDDEFSDFHFLFYSSWDQTPQKVRLGNYVHFLLPQPITQVIPKIFPTIIFNNGTSDQTFIFRKWHELSRHLQAAHPGVRTISHSCQHFASRCQCQIFFEFYLRFICSNVILSLWTRVHHSFVRDRENGPIHLHLHHQNTPPIFPVPFTH